MRARRTLLYVPGSDWRKIEKAASLGADCVCLDLEDGVAPSSKAEARTLISKALSELDFGRSERLVRVNAADSGQQAEDLLLASHPNLQGLVLPKAASAADVQTLGSALWSAEQARGLAPNTLALLAQIESALGLVNLKEIASADPHLVALVFGSEDFASDVGAIRTPEADEVFYARSAVATYAAAFGLQAIDMLHVNFKDAEGLGKLASQGARLGYSGMQIVHPDQIAPVLAAFTPSTEEIAWAQRVVDGYEQHTAEGRGAFALDGKMIDMPLVKAARRVLARAGK
ncbi:MAG TPA: CoA ester lyase [Anaerolineales bacterium]|nr:CoA ester lyase [Anaerolineales bacterium]HRQ92552.1 CoA ester lyase [Anaerolineales bacterium]